MALPAAHSYRLFQCVVHNTLWFRGRDPSAFCCEPDGGSTGCGCGYFRGNIRRSLFLHGDGTFQAGGAIPVNRCVCRGNRRRVTAFEPGADVLKDELPTSNPASAGNVQRRIRHSADFFYALLHKNGNK